MSCAARLAAIVVFTCWTATAAYAGPGGHGAGGGHGGGHGSGGHASGGHGLGHGSSGGRGSFGGHASHVGMSGNTAGRPAGHSVVHSIGHFFGFRGRTVNPAPPVSTIAPAQRRPVQPNLIFLRNPRIHPRHHKPFIFFSHGHSCFGGCPFTACPGNIFGGSGFNCFDDGFFGFWFAGLWGRSFDGPPTWAESDWMSSMPTSPEDPNGTNNSNTFVEAERRLARGPQDEQPVTLLQLVDGPMYGLTDYWIEGDQLHYITTYGGQNAVPIERIDFAKTAQLNADQGFVLRPKSSPH